MAGERLAKVIKNSRTKESELTDLVYGQVTGVSPLKIKIENRFEIGEQFIELSKMVQDFTINYSANGINVSKGLVEGVNVVTDVSVTEVQKKMQVFRALRVGDKVKMLSAQKSQKFYVLERV